MKIYCKKFVCSGLYIAAIVWFLTVAAFAEEVKIAAVVNNEVITTYDLDRELVKYKDQLDQMRDPQKRDALEKKGRADLLEDMIKDKLLDQEMKKMGISVTTPEVDDEVSRIAKRNGIPLDQFEKELKAQGMELRQYREGIKDHLELLKFISRKIRPKVQVDDQDIKSYYDTHQSKFASSDYLQLLQIRVGGEDARRHGEKIRAECRGANDPKAVARKYKSVEVTDLGQVYTKDLSPIFQEAVRDVKPGDLSRTLAGDKDIIFLKVVSRAQGEPMAFEEVREQIRGALFEKEIAQQLDLYIHNLRRTSHVEVRL